MAPGFSLTVNGIKIRTSEALYQACRFPHLPDVQRLIIAQGSPMAAKMRSKPFRKQSRPDWDKVRVKVMRWCLRVKLAQNWDTFGALLKSTDDKPIVEESKKDDFWGAYPQESGILVGGNVLGRLLMELRRELLGPGQESLRAVDPPGIGDFLLLGREIGTISARDATFAASQPPTPVELRGAQRAPLPFEAEHRDDVGPRTDVLDQDPRIAKYLTREELLELGKLGVRLSQTGVQLSRELSRNEFRGLWHLVGALNRRRPRTEDWVNWLVGDWRMPCRASKVKALPNGSSVRSKRHIPSVSTS